MMLLAPDVIYSVIFEHAGEILEKLLWVVYAVLSSLRSLLASASKALDDI